MVNKVMLKHRINHQRYDILICRIVKVSNSQGLFLSHLVWIFLFPVTWNASAWLKKWMTLSWNKHATCLSAAPVGGNVLLLSFIKHAAKLWSAVWMRVGCLCVACVGHACVCLSLWQGYTLAEEEEDPLIFQHRQIRGNQGDTLVSGPVEPGPMKKLHVSTTALQKVGWHTFLPLKQCNPI